MSQSSSIIITLMKCFLKFENKTQIENEGDHYYLQ